jgi:hypothetical protein
MNQQRARRIGMGMKPRGEEESLPTTEGQEVPASEGTEEPSAVTVEGGDLESVVTGQPSLHESDSLAEALKASAAEPVQNLDSPGESISDAPMWTDPLVEKLTDVFTAEIEGEKQYFVGTDFSDGSDKSVLAVIEGSAEQPEIVGIFDIQMGQLANGEFRTTICIREGYYEGVKQQAAADNMSLEEWLSLQLNTRLEEWYFAQPQR